MTNVEVLKSLCNAIANTFYPDDATLAVSLMNAGYVAEEDAMPKDASLFRVAVGLVLGYVESSRSECGVSAGVDREAVLRSLRFWCSQYGLDAGDVLPGVDQAIISDGSNLW